MASVFTFDPDPPRVSSPWSALPPSKKHSNGIHDLSEQSRGSQSPGVSLRPSSNGYCNNAVTCLAAEPQEGPTEYKVHLLLRPRRSLSYTSTPQRMSGSRPPRSGPSTPRTPTEVGIRPSTPLAQANGFRQHRLEQLTTQLLWRLQQSSPYHSTSVNNLILPSLPEATLELHAPHQPAKLLPGLEQSNGALYEIGVADDGTFVGLIEDEMTESLNNLRAMAASLGCYVDVLRMVEVGECAWLDDEGNGLFEETYKMKREKLFVAEAYIRPMLSNADSSQGNGRRQQEFEHAAQLEHTVTSANDHKPRTTSPHKEQLRVSFSGATTCGKSTLLGTLSTSTLDNGRGKSRLSLLKHRHEIASGMTSSVAQELIGYHEETRSSLGEVQSQVINYATGNVSSWDDIHGSVDSGRLAFLSDCAGHPRYRRTTVRGLVAWAPHWTLLCIAANDGCDFQSDDGRITPEGDNLSFPGASAHISMAHLDLCLKLELPLVVVITKLDAATKSSVRQILSTLLTSLKTAGRKPALLSNDSNPVSETDLQTIPFRDAAEVQALIARIGKDTTKTVPILFTSAVKGNGIGKLHALLRHLPIPNVTARESITGESDDQIDCPELLFHVDDSFHSNMRKGTATTDSDKLDDAGSILSGHLASGTISIGDQLLIGPFSSGAHSESSSTLALPSSYPSNAFLSPRTFTDALVKATSSPRIRAVPAEGEWRRVQVTSIRNLRIPVRTLQTDQVGTIGISSITGFLDHQPIPIRKGMVLTRGLPKAAHTFTASFDVAEASSVFVGSLVVIYCGTVRSSAKVIAVSLQRDPYYESRAKSPEPSLSGAEVSEDEFGFQLDEELESQAFRGGEEEILVSFQFVTYREWLQIGARVLVMPGGGQGGSEKGVKWLGGLDGFVGIVLEQFG